MQGKGLRGQRVLTPGRHGGETQEGAPREGGCAGINEARAGGAKEKEEKGVCEQVAAVGEQRGGTALCPAAWGCRDLGLQGPGAARPSRPVGTQPGQGGLAGLPGLLGTAEQPLPPPCLLLAGHGRGLLVLGVEQESSGVVWGAGGA